MTTPEKASVAKEILAGARQLTVSDLQRILQLSRNSIYRIIDGQELECIKIAESYRTTEAALNRFLNRASNRQPSKAVEKVTQSFPLVASRAHAEGVTNWQGMAGEEVSNRSVYDLGKAYASRIGNAAKRRQRTVTTGQSYTPESFDLRKAK